MRERRRKMGSEGPLSPGQEPVMEDVETLADHVTNFSLAGIRAVKQQIECQRRAGRA